MNGMSAIADDLSDMERRWERLSTVPETPHTLLRVLNYSVSAQSQAEVFMTRVLRYFLDPDRPHGMGDEFLRAFLEGLQQHQQTLPDGAAARPFDEDIYDLSGVEVARQVRLGNAAEAEQANIEPTGPVDLVIESPGEWFLVLELKFGASENNLTGEGPSQTEVYAGASHIEDREKSDFESGGYYLYLHTKDSKAARADAFTNWTWKAFTDNVLVDFIETNIARYPTRTSVQLREFRDDIRELTDMTTHDQNTEAKTELYFEHYEAITDVTDAFNERWQQFTDTWADQLATELSKAGHGELSKFDDSLPGVDINREGETERWIFSNLNTDWAHVFKHGWWRHTEDLDPLYERPSDRNDARVGFYHRLEDNRDLAIKDNTLRFTFRNMGANDAEFITEFNHQFRTKESKIRPLLPSEAELASISDTRRDLITATYPIRPDDHDSFFTAYVSALQEAFDDLVSDNTKLIEHIDESYATALNIYR